MGFFKTFFCSLPLLGINLAFSSQIISNFGRTGLLEIPTAYKVKDGSITFGGSYVYPYLRGFINIGFFPGLEIGAVITQIQNIDVKGKYWSGYGKYKDKAFFVKYQILPEKDSYPAVAIGWDDFHGTRLFDTKYLVLSKYLNFGLPQNLTIGLAKGKLLNGLFWGTEILLHPKLSLLTEYAPIEKNKLLGLKNEDIKSKFNIGIKYQPFHWLQTVVSYQRGNRFGINVNFNFPMGKPWVPHQKRFFKLSNEDLKLIKENKQTQFYEKALKRLKYDHVKVYTVGNTLVIEYSTDAYYFESVALRKALYILRVLYFPNIRWVKIVIKENNIPISEFIFTGKDINNFLLGRLDYKTLLQKAETKIANGYKVRNSEIFSFKWNLAPKLRTFLNDPSGAFKYMLSLDIGFTGYFYKHFRIDANLFVPFINNISSVNKPLMEKPVRSDIAYYLGQKHPNFSTLSLSYIDSVFPNTFGAISIGYNELMFAGIGGDIIRFFGDGKFAIGIGGDYVWKREPDKIFALKNWKYHDEYFSLYYVMEKPMVKFKIKAGRFLAGDKGVRFEISRIVHGFEVGFWYTYSDTSDFTGPNKNYHDKGVFVSIPLRMFKFKDTKAIGYYALSPWTRDVGQLAGRPFDLYELLYKKMPFYIRATAEEEE